MNKILQIVIPFFFGLSLSAQTLAPLPPHAAPYTGIFARGYWFTAPTNFRIVGLRVSPEAGTGTQNIHVAKMTAPPPTATTGTSVFTTLVYISGATNNQIQSVNIPITAGEVVCILGTTLGVSNSYGNGPFVSSIAGMPVSFYRLGYQGSIDLGPAATLWGVTTGQIGRIEMYWAFPSTSLNDAGAETIVEPTVGCVGVHPVKARIKNFGKNQIFSVVVNWSINGVNQTPIVHSSMLDTLNGAGANTAVVNLGNLTTVNLASYNIAAWTSLPNGVVDTVISNNQANKTIIGAAYPVINLGADTFLCPGATHTLSAGPGLDSAKWSTSATGSSIVVSTAGNYKVTGYKSGCSSKDSIVVGMFPAPPTVDIGGDTTICPNTNVVLNATTPGVTYLWQNNTTNATQTVNSPGTYWVVITDVNKCKSGDTLDVDTLSPAKVTLIAKPGNNLCYGFPYLFEAKPFNKGSKTFQWKINGVNAGSPTVDSLFNPSLKTKDSVSVDMLTSQCSTSVYPVTSNGVVMTLRPAPKIISGILGTDTVKENTKKNYGIGGDPGHTYLWQVKGGSIIGDSTTTAVQIQWGGGVNDSAQVILKDKDQTNCTYPNVLPVYITSIVGVNKIGSVELKPAYPNPADHTINIPVYAANSSEIQLSLYDITGKKVEEIFNGLVTGNRTFTMSVDKLEEGMYFYRITTSEGYEAVKKITIQH